MRRTRSFKKFDEIITRHNRFNILLNRFPAFQSYIHNNDSNFINNFRHQIYIKDILYNKFVYTYMHYNIFYK